MFRKFRHGFSRSSVGQWLMITGAAKVGKTHAAASLYKHFDRKDIFFVSCFETDGWVTAEKVAGGEIYGFDCQELMGEKNPIQTLFKILSSVDDSQKAVIFDSLDGASRWFESVLFRSSARRDRETGVGKMDKPAHGKKLNFVRELVMDVLYPLTMRGIHVVATCGLAPREIRNGDDTRTRYALDLSGQNSWQVPRYFSDVCRVEKLGRDNERQLIFSDPSSDVGSRRGYPDRMKAEELGKLLFETKAAPRSAPKVESVDDTTGARIESHYKLTPDDIAVLEKHVGRSPFEVSDWHYRAWAAAAKRRESGNPVTGHDRALMLIVQSVLFDRQVQKLRELGIKDDNGREIESLSVNKLIELYKANKPKSQAHKRPKPRPEQTPKKPEAAEPSKQKASPRQPGHSETSGAAARNRLRRWEKGEDKEPKTKVNVDSCPYDELQETLEKVDHKWDRVCSFGHVQNLPLNDQPLEALKLIKKGLQLAAKIETAEDLKASEIGKAYIKIADALGPQQPDDRKNVFRIYLKSRKAVVPRARTLVAMLDKASPELVISFAKTFSN